MKIMDYFVVASISKVGSTMMRDYLKWKFPFNHVQHTHRPPESIYSFPMDGKAIFMFGDPRNVVAAKKPVLNKRFFLGNVGNERIRTSQRSIKIIGGLFDAWYKPQRFAMMSVRYETMWDNLDKIAEFFEIDDISDFPEYRPRETDWTKHPQADKLEKAFAPLVEKFAKADDAKIWKIKR